ncbi:MAG TPA: nickel-dependent lactate racemase [Anaerolineaceae bacterium]
MAHRIQVPFGAAQIAFELPPGIETHVLPPRPVAPSADPHAEIERALESPLGSPRIEDVVRAGDRATVLVDDYTRATPAALVLPHLLERIRRCGVPDDAITLLVSTGTHRPMREEELCQKVGGAVFRRYETVQHDCLDRESQVFLGLTSRGTPVWVNRRAVETDHLFGIGHIDPSDYAGYAGGRKLIVPGVAALETVDANHALAALSFRRYGDIRLACRQDIDEAGALVPAALFINLVLCQDGQIARAFAGAPEEIHPRGVELARQVYEVDCPGPVDFCVASAYPYDVDFYQAIRAVEYADLIVRPGGSILLAAPCPEGIGSQEFFRLLSGAEHSPADFLRRVARREGKVTYNVLGYFLARILEEKEVYGYLPGVPPAEAEAMGIHPVETLQGGIEQLLARHGPRARAAVMPVGSATIPRLKPQG